MESDGIGWGSDRRQTDEGKHTSVLVCEEVRPCRGAVGTGS